VLAEPIQTVMRRFGVQGAYEQLKEVTRGKTGHGRGAARLIRSLEIPEGKGPAAGHDAGQLRGQGCGARQPDLKRAHTLAHPWPSNPPSSRLPSRWPTSTTATTPTMR
jgi:hypothetical protein